MEIKTEFYLKKVTEILEKIEKESCVIYYSGSRINSEAIVADKLIHIVGTGALQHRYHGTFWSRGIGTHQYFTRPGIG